MKKKNKIREGNPAITVLLYIAAGAVAFITFYPMYYVLILSLSEPQFAATMKVYTWPKGFNSVAYEILVKDAKMWRAYANTFLYVVSNTVLVVTTCTLVAYGLSYKNLIGRKFLTMFLLVPMYFSGGMIPHFLLIMKLGLYDSPLSQIIPAAFSIWDIILQVLTNVFLPLGKPIFAVIAVYTIVGTWNSWFNAMIYLPHTDWQPLQLHLRRVLVSSSQMLSQVMDQAAAKEAAAKALSNAQLQYAMIIFTSLPVLAAYPFFQRYFVKGMVLGSLKE